MYIGWISKIIQDNITDYQHYRNDGERCKWWELRHESDVRHW
jgi:hypothetical protein